MDKHEELCKECEGTGIRLHKRWYHSSTTCLACSSDGKRLKCTRCGRLAKHGLQQHRDYLTDCSWMDTLCERCIGTRITNIVAAFEA